MSSGEANMMFIGAVLKQKPDFLIIDELERGLSVKNQLTLAYAMAKHVRKGSLTQLVCSCHSQTIIEFWETIGIVDLFDVEQNKIVTWKDYYRTQLEKTEIIFAQFG